MEGAQRGGRRKWRERRGREGVSGDKEEATKLVSNRGTAVRTVSRMSMFGRYPRCMTAGSRLIRYPGDPWELRYLLMLFSRVVLPLPAMPAQTHQQHFCDLRSQLSRRLPCIFPQSLSDEYKPLNFKASSPTLQEIRL